MSLPRGLECYAGLYAAATPPRLPRGRSSSRGRPECRPCARPGPKVDKGDTSTAEGVERLEAFFYGRPAQDAGKPELPPPPAPALPSNALPERPTPYQMARPPQRLEVPEVPVPVHPALPSKGQRRGSRRRQPDHADASAAHPAAAAQEQQAEVATPWQDPARQQAEVSSAGPFADRVEVQEQVSALEQAAAPQETAPSSQAGAAPQADVQSQLGLQQPQVAVDASSLGPLAPHLSRLTSSQLHNLQATAGHLAGRLPQWELELPALPSLPNLRQLPSLPNLPSPSALPSGFELEGPDLGPLKEALAQLHQLSAQQLDNLRVAAQQALRRRQQQQVAGAEGAAAPAGQAPHQQRQQQQGEAAAAPTDVQEGPREAQARSQEDTTQLEAGGTSQQEAAGPSAQERAVQYQRLEQQLGQEVEPAPAEQPVLEAARAGPSASAASAEAAAASSLAGQGLGTRLWEAVHMSVPSMQLPQLGLREWKQRGLTAWGWGLVLLVAATVMTGVRMLMGRQRLWAQEAIRDAEARARAAQQKERQRRRFQRALQAAEDFEGSSIDSSVFASVSKKRGSPSLNSPSEGKVAAGTDDMAAGDGNENPFMRGMGTAAAAFSMDSWEEQAEEGAALDDLAQGLSDDVYDPSSWDESTRRAWDSFVSSSKVGQGKLWDPSHVDQGLPSTDVDLEKDVYLKELKGFDGL